MTPAGVDRALRQIRHEAPDVPVVLDLQGAKMRLGRFAERALSVGDDLVLTLGEEGNGIPLPHPELFRAMRAGDTLRCDDDRVHLRVLRATSDRIEAQALHDGVLRPRKGVNVMEHPVELDALTAGDLAQIQVARGYAGVQLACSFVRDGRELGWVADHAPGLRLIAKVERQEAIDHLEELEQATDELWICRGDLGAQLGLGSLARWLHLFVPAGRRKPYLIAGQVFEHLTAHASPTRSEVCHLFDLLSRGYEGVVLSDETAIGCDPVNAVATTSSLLRDFNDAR
jgi:pyruvate kinase